MTVDLRHVWLILYSCGAHQSDAGDYIWTGETLTAVALRTRGLAPRDSRDLETLRPSYDYVRPSMPGPGVFSALGVLVKVIKAFVIETHFASKSKFAVEPEMPSLKHYLRPLMFRQAESTKRMVVSKIRPL